MLQNQPVAFPLLSKQKNVLQEDECFTWDKRIFIAFLEAMKDESKANWEHNKGESHV